MTKSEELAILSTTEIVTMKMVNEAGGSWVFGSNPATLTEVVQKSEGYFIFKDGSKGAFTKNMPALKTEHGNRVFSHYRFEVIQDEIQ